jgi:glycosyltransferase involved in cell wall biosynthesis
MSVYNGAPHLREAIDSVLAQTFTDFEFIIVNDSSTDSSEEIIKSYNDPRIVLLTNETNMGLPYSLNKGIANAKGKYIARMDDDDICFPERFQKQVEFLEQHPQVGVLGTYAQLVGNEGGIRKHSTHSDELKNRMLFSCQFCHPTVFIRKSVLQKNNLQYNTAFTTSQDYELWSRMIGLTEFSTLPETLLKYRVHNKQLSKARQAEQLDNTYKVYAGMLSKIGITEVSLLPLHRRLADFNFVRSEKMEDVVAYLFRLMQGNKTARFFPEPSFGRFISNYFYNICTHSKIGSLKALRLFSKFQFHKTTNVSLARFKIFIRQTLL